jgi:hypothetical protein
MALLNFSVEQVIPWPELLIKSEESGALEIQEPSLVHGVLLTVPSGSSVRHTLTVGRGTVSASRDSGSLHQSERRSPTGLGV